MATANRVTLIPNRSRTFGRRASDAIHFTERLSAKEKQYLKQFLHEPPAPKGDPEFDLARIIGDNAVAAITKDKEISFQAAGDTGHGTHTPQEDVARAMALDCPVGGS